MSNVELVKDEEGESEVPSRGENTEWSGFDGENDTDIFGGEGWGDTSKHNVHKHSPLRKRKRRKYTVTVKTKPYKVYILQRKLRFGRKLSEEMMDHVIKRVGVMAGEADEKKGKEKIECKKRRISATRVKSETFDFPKHVKMTRVLLVRVGSSVSREKGYVDNWLDYELGPTGRKDMQKVAFSIIRKNYKFDEAYCSCTSRARDTARMILLGTGQRLLGVKLCWRLNPRMAGVLIGTHLDGNVHRWGRLTPWFWQANGPPELPSHHPHFLNVYRSPLYKNIEHLPTSESSLEMILRVAPVWYDEICKKILEGRRSILVCAHGDSINGLLACMTGITALDMTIWAPSHHVPIELYFQRGINSKFNLLGMSFLGNTENQLRETNRFNTMLRKRMENLGYRGKTMYLEAAKLQKKGKRVPWGYFIFKNIVKLNPLNPSEDVEESVRRTLQKHPEFRDINTQFQYHLKKSERKKYDIDKMISIIKDRLFNIAYGGPNYQEKIKELKAFQNRLKPALRQILGRTIQELLAMLKREQRKSISKFKNARDTVQLHQMMKRRTPRIDIMKQFRPAKTVEEVLNSMGMSVIIPPNQKLQDKDQKLVENRISRSTIPGLNKSNKSPSKKYVEKMK